MLNRFSYLLFAVFFISTTGCSLEQKISRNFVESEKNMQFYLLKPEIVFKYNLKEFEVPGLDTLDEVRKEIRLMKYSLFLQDVSDSLFIEEFVSGFVKTLRSYGADVLFENETDTLMEKGGTPYIVNLAQISLEEYIHPYHTEETVYDEIIVIDGIDLNAINYNLWLELSRLNTEKNNKVLFASDYLLDNLNGTLRHNLLTGKISFDYTIDTISSYRIYDFARKFGKTTAGYLFDYLMNDYMWENLPEDYPYTGHYYHYDPVRRLFYLVEDDRRFIEVESN